MTHHDRNHHDTEKKDPEPMTRRFLTACFCLFGGILLVYFAFELIAKIWLTLVIAGLIVGGIFVAIRLLQAKRNRW